MITALTTLAGVLAASPIVEHQHLEVALAPDAHTAAVTSRLRARGAGELRLRLIEQAEIAQLLLDGAPADFDRAPDAQEPRVSILTVTLPGPRSELLVRYGARFVEDVAAGERPGEIHNKSVEAHVGPDGIFLADGAAWHPLPLAADGRPALHAMAVDVEPLEGWAIVASGDPVAHLQSIDEPVWNWRTPRPVDGMALVGGQHELYGRLHASTYRPGTRPWRRCSSTPRAHTSICTRRCWGRFRTSASPSSRTSSLPASPIPASRCWGRASWAWPHGR
jgi:hypothetical protein